jgi:hypothetical protein
MHLVYECQNPLFSCHNDVVHLTGSTECATLIDLSAVFCRGRHIQFTQISSLQMASESDQRRSIRVSPVILWMNLILVALLLVVLLESTSLAILYVYDSLTGTDTRAFAEEHLLTKAFAPSVPGEQQHLSSAFASDGLLGWRLVPAASVFDEDHTNKYLFITDSNGFIVDVDDPPVTLDKPPDAYRVIVLGGSTVLGYGAPRPSQNIVGMLRKEVRERGLKGANGKHVEFINAGVDNYNSTQEYLYLVSDLLRFRPDLVIVYDGWNDSHLTNHSSPYRHSQFERRIAQSYSIIGSARLFAANLVHFFTDSNFRLGLIELPWRVFRNQSPDANSPTLPVDPPFDLRSMELYRQNRRAFLALADDDLSVALFLQPLVGTDDRPLSAEEKASWWWPRLDEALGNRVPFYEHARNILAGLKEKVHGDGHACIADLSHSLTGVSEPVYADSGHLLPKGNAIVASHMVDELVSCRILR